MHFTKVFSLVCQRTLIVAASVHSFVDGAYSWKGLLMMSTPQSQWSAITLSSLPELRCAADEQRRVYVVSFCKEHYQVDNINLKYYSFIQRGQVYIFINRWQSSVCVKLLRSLGSFSTLLCELGGWWIEISSSCWRTDWLKHSVVARSIARSHWFVLWSCGLSTVTTMRYVLCLSLSVFLCACERPELPRCILSIFVPLFFRWHFSLSCMYHVHMYTCVGSW